MKNNQQETGKVYQSYSLKPAQQQAFLEVFNLHAQDGKISKTDLEDIFNRIGFKISELNFEDICKQVFLNRQMISFEEFMETFKVKQSNYDLVDIKNAFRLIAADSDSLIPVSHLRQLFEKQEIESHRVDQLLLLLESYIDEKEMFNFKMLLSHLS